MVASAMKYFDEAFNGVTRNPTSRHNTAS